MTNEEAIIIAQGLIKDFKCKSETMVDFCNTIIKALKQESCDDCISRQAVFDKMKERDEELSSICRRDIRELLNVIPQQGPILEKIRAEIEAEKNAGCHTQYAGGLDFALSIIDKYKAESEEE